MRNYRQHIRTANSIVVIFDDGQFQVHAANPLYARIVEALKEYAFEKVAELVDLSGKLKQTKDARFWVGDGLIHFEGDALPDSLSKRLIAFIDEALPTEPLVNFWRNLKENPSADSRKDLYGFLEANHVPLTEDGCFIGYKRVDDNYKDLQTHTFDNSVGKVVSMPRDAVNPDRNQTCSTGLHVAAFEYADKFYSNGHLMEIKVNPKNVVAVPTDYNQQKMRVCEYEVMAEYKGPRVEQLYNYEPGEQTEEYIECATCEGDGNVWNDDTEEMDECPDCRGCGEVVVEVNHAEEEVVDGDEDETWEGGESRSDAVVAPSMIRRNAEGRLKVPAVFVKALGLKPGDNAYVALSNMEEIYISKSVDDVDDGSHTVFIYKVDNEYHVRLSNKLCDEIGAKGSYDIEIIDGIVVIA